jgi:Uma2 family endonuclease
MGMAIAFPRYTVDELENFPEDGNRYELLDGMLLVTPAPGMPHQIVISRLQSYLMDGVQRPGHAYVVGPGVVTRPPVTQLEPDILVYPTRFSPNSDWRKVDEHWLAIEVFSRSSRVYDREFKRDAYFALGVQQVWLVDWRDKSVEVCRRRGVSEVARDTIRWKVPTLDLIVPIPLNEIFAGLI